MGKEVFLKLFVAGKTSRSKQAIEGVTVAFDMYLKEKGTLEIIDLLVHPQQAQEEQVMATPTLIRVTPAPVRRVIGDFSDGKKALDLLGLRDETP